MCIVYVVYILYIVYLWVVCVCWACNGHNCHLVISDIDTRRGPNKCNLHVLSFLTNVRAD